MSLIPPDLRVPTCFTTPDTVVGSSRNSIVVGYRRARLVAKCDRPAAERVYTGQKAVFERVEREQRERKIACAELQGRSHSPDIVPAIDVVIHDGHQGEITYTEVQEWFPDSQTLAELGLKTFKEPACVLEDLRGIILLSLDHCRKTGDLYDLQGTVEGLGAFQKILSAASPLFSSTNILIDSDHNVRFIDATTLIGIKLPLRTRIHRIIKMLGARASLAAINLALRFKDRPPLHRQSTPPS